MVKILSTACTAAVLLFLPASAAQAGEATAFGAVGSIAYGDVDYDNGQVKEETAIAAGGAVGFLNTHGTAEANLDASWDARASANGEVATDGPTATASVSGGDHHGDGDGDGGDEGATARSSGSLSMSASSSAD